MQIDRETGGKRRDRHDEVAADIFSIVLLSQLNVMLNFAIKAMYTVPRRKILLRKIFLRINRKKILMWILNANVGRCDYIRHVCVSCIIFVI
jgi:hypothetical protein